ncbi:MAG: hypothetical protein GY928_36685 [Colwellia sp.]|nr:hypothetical protein [Colwellia sp.]
MTNAELALSIVAKKKSIRPATTLDEELSKQAELEIKRRKALPGNTVSISEAEAIERFYNKAKRQD